MIYLGRSSSHIALKAALFSNVLLWSVPVPFFDELGFSLYFNTVITIMAGFFVKKQNTYNPYIFYFMCSIPVYGVAVFFMGPCQEYYVRVISASLSLFVLMYSTIKLAGSVGLNESLIDARDVKLMLLVVCAMCVFGYYEAVSSGAGYLDVRTGGLYHEPSHLAISVAPLLMFLWRGGVRRDSRYATICFLLLMVVSFSTTLIFLVFVLFMLDSMIDGNFLLGFLIIFAGLLGFFYGDFYAVNHTIERLDGILQFEGDSNISSLVYINGWQLMIEYLKSTNGFGLGINAMGCSPRATTVATEFLARFELEDLNYNDGSFLLSKIGSEFGFYGLFIWLLSLIITMKFAMHKKIGININTNRIGYYFMAMLSIGGLLRSTGYFAGPVQLALLLMIVITASYKSNKIAE